MPCLVALIAVFFPRVVIVLLFLFERGWLDGAYETTLWPVLGFIFMPFTTLGYALAINQAGALTGLYLVLFVIAVLMDLGAWGGGPTARRRHVVEVRRR